MSFRSFVYWSALCGGWAAAGGWALGRLLAGDDPLGSAGVKGMCLGFFIALTLGFVDSLWVFSLRQLRQIAPRVLVGVVVGSVGGLLGGYLGQLLYGLKNVEFLLLLGWLYTGLMVGLSQGAFDFLRSWVLEEDLEGAQRKVIRGILGGAIGGLLGGVLYAQLKSASLGFLPRRDDLWSPSLTGFILLGLSIGLSIGVAQVVLKEAWLLVEAGFRKGRELPLSKPLLTVGRAESCDIGLFGDAAVDRLHARIVRKGSDYLIADAGSSTGTFVNDARIDGPTPLRSGDQIRLGNSLLRFRERKNRK